MFESEKYPRLLGGSLGVKARTTAVYVGGPGRTNNWEYVVSMLTIYQLKLKGTFTVGLNVFLGVDGMRFSSGPKSLYIFKTYPSTIFYHSP